MRENTINNSPAESSYHIRRFRGTTDTDATNGGERVAASPVSVFDRLRILNRKNLGTLFGKELATKGVAGDMEGLTGEGAKGFYDHLYSKNLKPFGKTIQESVAEEAHNGGVGIGKDKFSYEAPIKDLKNMGGMHFSGLDNVPFMDKILQLVRKDPEAARIIAAPQRIPKDTFGIWVTPTKPTYVGTSFLADGTPAFKNQSDPRYWKLAQPRTVDLVDLETPGMLKDGEGDSLEPFVKSLLHGADGPQMSPRQFLQLQDLYQSKNTSNLRKLGGAEDWVTRVMGTAGEALASDAKHVGIMNFTVSCVKFGLLILSLVPFAAVGISAIIAGAHINPSDNQVAQPADQENPYAAPTSTDPADAFSQFKQSGSPAPSATPGTAQGGYVTPTPLNQPFGAMNQNFGTLDVNMPGALGIGALPTVTVRGREQGPFGNPTSGPIPYNMYSSNPSYGQNPDGYGWVRQSEAARRVLTAQSTQVGQNTQVGPDAQSPQDNQSVDPGSVGEDPEFRDAANQALEGVPTEGQMNAAFNAALSLGDTPQGHQKMLDLFNAFGKFAPQFQRFEADGAQHTQQSDPTQTGNTSSTPMPDDDLATQRQPALASNRRRFAADSGEAALHAIPGYNMLMKGDMTNTAGFIHGYQGQYAAAVDRANKDPQFAAWWRSNPEYMVGRNPEHESYEGSGPESAQSARQNDPNEDWIQKYQRDLEQMNKPNFRQYEDGAAQGKGQTADFYNRTPLTDASGNPVGQSVGNAYSTINPTTGGYPPSYAQSTFSQPGVQGMPAPPQARNIAAPAKPQWVWQNNANGGSWVSQ